MLSLLAADTIPCPGGEIIFENHSNWQVQQKDKGFHLYHSEKFPGAKLLIQVEEGRKLAHWHLLRLPQVQHTFQKYYDKSRGSRRETLNNMWYDAEKFRLVMNWKDPDGQAMLSFIKLTSFGTVSFHISAPPEMQPTIYHELGRLSGELQIPEKLRYIPENMADNIIEDLGGAVVFIFLSLIYLTMSLLSRRKGQRLKRLHKRISDADQQSLTKARST